MICYTSTVKTLGLIFIAILLVVASVFAALNAPGFVMVVGWFGVVFFGAALIAIVRQLFNRSPVVTLTPEGITSPRFVPDGVAWTRVARISVGKVQHNRFLCLWLKDEEAYVASLTGLRKAAAIANSKMGFPAISITFQNLTPGLDEALAYITQLGIVDTVPAKR